MEHDISFHLQSVSGGTLSIMKLTGMGLLHLIDP